MRHENSVFHGLTKHIPWTEFERLVERHNANRRVRQLSCKHQLLALLYGQLSGAASLREIEAGLAGHQARLHHLGGRCPKRSTLADANARRPWALFADLFAHMVANANRATRRSMGDATRIIDATKMRLSGVGAEWAKFSETHSATKLHIVYDPNAEMPLHADVTADTVNDITPAKALEIEPGATYVVDLAYYDFTWWAKLDALGCRFVTRLKTRTFIRVDAERPVPEDSNILSDRTGFITQRVARARRNPLAEIPLREITVRIPTGKILRLVTNDLDSPVEEIADLYKQRWQIELFFKWIKQNLKIRHFLGRSENAVRIQLFVALIAYLILRQAYAVQSTIKRAQHFARLVRLYLMERRPYDCLNAPFQPPPIDPRQMSLVLVPC